MQKVLSVIILATLICFASFFSCTSEEDFLKGKKVLENQGYTDITNEGYYWFCCGEDDTYSTGFKAISKKGEEVEGCICSCVGKGITVRFK